MGKIPFISAHIINRENTYLGREFLESCFLSLEESQFPNEVLIVDNGSSDFIFDTYNTWKEKFNSFDCELKVFPCELSSFSDLRNLCLEKTNPYTDFFLKIDSDEVYYPEDLDILKNHIPYEAGDIQFFWVSFYHFMLSPFKIQVNPDNMKYGKTPKNDDARSIKDTIFAYGPNVKWVKAQKVHEHVENMVGNVVVPTKVEYLHAGYCRKQWETALKWLRYAELEFGNINCYKKENITVEDKTGKEVSNSFMGKEGYTAKTVDYFRNWRTPNMLCHDRRKCTMPYPGKLTNKDYLPQGWVNLIKDCKNESDWIEYINKLDPTDFWQWWEEEYIRCGNWSDTLEPALLKARKEGILN